MKTIRNFWTNWHKGLLKTTLVAVLLLFTSIGLNGAGWHNTNEPILISILAQGDPVTDPRAILQDALPVDNPTIRKVESDLEGISKGIKGKQWSKVNRDIKDASYLLSSKRDVILASIPDERKPQAETLLDEVKTGITELQGLAEGQNKPEILLKRNSVLNQINQLEELMVQKFPFEVPEKYNNLPQLKGRATVEVKTTQGDLTIVVDGYSAPVNGGNFVDLVQRGFYDGLPFIRSEDNFVAQTGDPSGPEEGFIDPKTGEYRAIPLEVLVKGEEKPIYETTLEDAGIYLPNLALPFSAYGAVALARPDVDANGGSSQFFFFKFDNELTPPGFNLMDGRYSVFGYVVDGKDVLNKLTDKDKIISAKVVYGLDNLVQPAAS